MNTHTTTAPGAVLTQRQLVRSAAKLEALRQKIAADVAEADQLAELIKQQPLSGSWLGVRVGRPMPRSLADLIRA